MAGQEYDKQTLRGWFNALDIDHSGQISMSEFFVFALQESLARSGAL